MKTNNITKATEILILVATVIVVCVFCAIGFKITSEGKSAATAGTSNFNTMTGQYQDIDKAIYDGTTVQGSEVENIIKRELTSEDTLAIRVSTKASSNRDYIYNFTPPSGTSTTGSLGTKSTNTVSTTKTDAYYINPQASFAGKVYKDANGIIICIEFTQQ